MKVAIIGGGILGVSAAYHLTRGHAEVILIDRKDAGQATDAAAGIICPWLSQRRNKAWYALAKAGAAYYPHLIGQLQEDGYRETGYRNVGALSIHTDVEKLRKLEKRALERRLDAPEIGTIEQLDNLETGRRFPILSSDFSAVHVSGAARVDGRALRNAMLESSIKNGLKHINGSASLQLTSEGTVRILVEGEYIVADKIIITAGCWAGELMKTIGVGMQVRGQKAQIAHLNVKQTDTDNWPVVMPPNDQYMLSFDKGKIVIGATHEDNIALDSTVTAGGMHELLDKAMYVAPLLKDASIEEVRVGFRPFTPGFLPVIGEVPNFQNLLFANGLGSSGLTVGPFLGKQLAHLALGEDADIDLTPYTVNAAMDGIS